MYVNIIIHSLLKIEFIIFKDLYFNAFNLYN